MPCNLHGDLDVGLWNVLGSLRFRGFRVIYLKCYFRLLVVNRFGFLVFWGVRVRVAGSQLEDRVIMLRML